MFNLINIFRKKDILLKDQGSDRRKNKHRKINDNDNSFSIIFRNILSKRPLLITNAEFRHKRNWTVMRSLLQIKTFVYRILITKFFL